jgi:hypothetical protein
MSSVVGRVGCFQPRVVFNNLSCWVLQRVQFHVQAAAWPAGAVSSCIESQSAVGIRIRAILLGTLPGILQAFDRLFITALLVPC